MRLVFEMRANLVTSILQTMQARYTIALQHPQQSLGRPGLPPACLVA
jgi:hypothetical protein